MAGIYGLSGSGMDIDAIVKNLIKAQSMRYDKLSQNKTLLEWKKSDYNTIYTSINEFRNTAVWNNTLQNNLMPKSVISSNESIVKVTANADAANVNHVITVNQLASGVTKTSSANITTGANKNTIGEQFGVTGRFDLQINGRKITVDSSQSIYSLVSTINSSGAGVQASYDANMDRFFLHSSATGSDAYIHFNGSSAAGLNFLTNKLKLDTMPKIGTEGTTSFYDTFYGDDTSQTLDKMGYSNSFTLRLRNGNDMVNIDVDTTVDTMDSLLAKINSAGINAEASYDDTNGTFSIKALSGSLDFSGSDPAGLSFVANQLKISTLTTGTDAKFILDGAELTQKSNSFTISGVSYNLLGTGTLSVNVSTDKSKIIENVKSFIEAYNTQLSKLNVVVKETRNRDFLPLTSEERSALSESEVKEWETKAKSGMLYRDPILLDAISNMRNDIMSPIKGLTGKYTTASSIGITTGEYSEGGKLYLDEAKLMAALEADPNIVDKIFGADNSDGIHAQKGIANRLYDTLKSVSDKIATEAGATVGSEAKSNLAKQIATYKQNMDDWTIRLQTMEKNYYKKFNAMEVALSSLLRQGSWLDSHFASMSSSS